MSKPSPDHHDAELVLRVYDLRREALMREARSALNAKFLPRTYEDVLALTKGEHPLNAAYRQVTTYWEMVYGIARHGIVHAEYFMESNGEGLLTYAKVAPYLEAYRRDVSSVAFSNAEWVSNETAAGRRYLQVFTARIQKLLESK